MATQKSPIGESALATATSANGTARNGPTLPTNGLATGTLIADCACTIVTGSVVATFRWQGSADGTTWVDLKESNNPTPTTLTATGTTAINCPSGAWGFEYVRATATLSGAATAGGDTTTVLYRYRAYSY